MSINSTLKKLILTTLLLTVTAMAQTPYDEGQKALREQDWTRASEFFEQAIKDDDNKADASMYWRAHALYKANRAREAKRQIRSLERKYPDSRWLKEAQILQIEHDGSAALASGGDAQPLDDELRMFALARLMERDPERALPLVMDMVKNTDSEDVSGEMLFLLGMSEAPQAQKLIAEIASDSSNPKLQLDAIHMLGIASDKPSMALLADLYRQSDSGDVKRAVIQAHIISDEAGTLVEILKDEQDPRLQEEIIHALGAMQASGVLKEIYPTLTNEDIKVAALEAFFIAGDGEILKQVLETETSPKLRKTAIRGIALTDDKNAAALLESIYENAPSVAEKKAVLEALVMMDEAEELALKVVRTETDDGLRRDAIRSLGIMDATTELAELYASIDETDLRETVLESMMIADDTDGIIKVLESEKNPELRAAAMQALSINGGDDAAGYLVSLYPKGSREEKHAIIEAMMMMDSPERLISLIKTETDPNLKHEMLRVLTLMDSEASDDYLFELLESEK